MSYELCCLREDLHGDREEVHADRGVNAAVEDVAPKAQQLSDRSHGGRVDYKRTHTKRG